MILWTSVYKFLRGHIFLLLLGKYVGVEFLGLMIKYMFNFFKERSDFFLKWSFHFIFIPAMREVSSLFTSSLTLCIVSRFYCSSSTGLVVVSCCPFNVHFPINNDIGHLVMSLVAIHVYSTVKCLIKSCVHFLPGRLPFTIARVIYIFWIQTIYIWFIYRYMIYTYFFLIYGLSFHFISLWWFLKKYLILMSLKFVNFFYYGWCFGCHI